MDVESTATKSPFPYLSLKPSSIQNNNLFELVQVHRCIDIEARKLYALVCNIGNCIQQQEAAGMVRNEIEKADEQLEKLWKAHQSHSKAEDDFILPACRERGLSLHDHEDIGKQHVSHITYFQELKMILNLMKKDGNDNNSMIINIETAKKAITIAHELVQSLILHMRLEEEEVLPVLEKNFTKEEISQLVGQIMGVRSSELIQLYLDMTSTDLSPSDNQIVIENICQSAKGTRFNRWLEKYQTGKGDLECKHHHHEQQLHDHSHAMDTDQDHLMSSPSTSSVHSSSDDSKSSMSTSKRSKIANEFALPCNPKISVMDIKLSPNEGAIVSFADEASKKFGCAHFRRGCKIFAPCCGRLFSCHNCHDEHVEKMSVQGNAHWHKINRDDIKFVWCMSCETLQPFSESCVKCNTKFGSYYCKPCKIIEEQADIYHCPFCDICRRGKGLGQDFFHCMKCNACVSTQLRQHTCVTQALEGDCPICCENLFTTRKLTCSLPCGHVLHRSCFNEHLKSGDYRCSLCRASMIEMKSYWESLDKKLPPIPQSINDIRRRIVAIQCRDCHATGQVISSDDRLRLVRSSGIAIGEKCFQCGSYNTQLG